MLTPPKSTAVMMSSRADEQAPFDQSDPYAGIARRLNIATHHIDETTKCGAVQHNREDNEERKENQNRSRERSDRSLLTERVEPVRKTADRAIFEQNAAMPR